MRRIYRCTIVALIYPAVPLSTGVTQALFPHLVIVNRDPTTTTTMARE